jgi:hypothetical protein
VKPSAVRTETLADRGLLAQSIEPLKKIINKVYLKLLIDQGSGRGAHSTIIYSRQSPSRLPMKL